MRKQTVSILAVLLLSSIVFTAPVPASAPPGGMANGSQAAAPVMEAAPVFLPLVMNNARYQPACTADSPFGLAIAALYQVQPGSELTQALVEDGLLLQALKESGTCWTHIGIDWSQIQPDAPVDGQPPVYRWGWYDQTLALVAGTGVQLNAVIEFVPDWARGEPYPDLRCTHVDPDRLDEFAQFLTDLVSRYKEPPWNIHHWELRNEPDGTTADRADVGQGCGGFRADLYAQMLAVAYPAIKAADPTATVLMGGVAHDWFTENYPVSPPDGKFYRYFPDEVMANGGGAYVDATNFHFFHDYFQEWERWDPNSEDRRKGWLPAPTCGDLFDGEGQEYEAGGIDLIAKTTHFRNRLSTCFGVNKPVWITELAEHGYPGDPVSLAQQARYVIQGQLRGLAAGVENITWFALVTPPYDPAEQGLLDQDFTPKPAYRAYQTLMRELAGYEYSHTLTDPGVEGYVFRNVWQHETTVAWAWGAPSQPAYLTFAPAFRLRVVDREGTVSYIQDGGVGDTDGTQNGSIRLQLPAPPVDPSPDPPRLTAEPLFITK